VGVKVDCTVGNDKSRVEMLSRMLTVRVCVASMLLTWRCSTRTDDHSAARSAAGSENAGGTGAAVSSGVAAGAWVVGCGLIPELVLVAVSSSRVRSCRLSILEGNSESVVAGEPGAANAGIFNGNIPVRAATLS
jgi:hypothetical protein